MGKKCWWYIQNKRGSKKYKNVKLRHAQEHVAGILRKKSTLSHTRATKKKVLSFKTEIAFKTQNRRPHHCGRQHHLPSRNQKMFIVIAKFINATMSCGELEWTLRRQWQLHMQSLDWMWWMIAIPQELLTKCLVWIEGSYFRRCGVRKGGSQTFIHSPFCGHTISILATAKINHVRELQSLQFQARLQPVQVRRPLQLIRSLRFQPRLQQLQFKFQLLQVRRPLRPLRSLRF